MNIDVKTHSEWHEEPGNDVCNYCATREARQHTNHVEVFLGSSQQISTVDIVTVWRRGGDYITPFFVTLLFSVTSFVKPAFSVV